MRKIELLAPARNFETAVVAVDCGADAIYMGGSGFGARHAATNTTDDVRRAAEYAHMFGVRLYATLNTLVYDNELVRAERLARELIDAGADALIVQDMAYRQMNLPVEMHASTQMCNMQSEDIAFLEGCGFSRVILERALSIDEIRTIRAATSVDLECFVHGAICVGHSGRCFLSRSVSDRSGNRGSCSQPCRLTYDLVDSRGEKIISGRHLLSVRDLDLSARIGEMIDAGVGSFKIEGRLKDDIYIRNVVSHYRRQIDRALADRPDCTRASAGRSVIDFTPDPAKSFTRGASEYMFHGKAAGVASFDTPKAVGEWLGNVSSVDARGFVLDRNADLSPGDGLCFLSNGTLTGSNINRVDSRRVEPNRMEGICVGAEVFRNYDRRFAQAVERSKVRRQIDARCRVSFDAGSIVLTYTDEEGLQGVARRDIELDAAQNVERMTSTLREQVARSGATVFRITEVEIEGEVRFVPLSLLGELRREALESLTSQRALRVPQRRIVADNGSARYPRAVVDEYGNVVNSLAEKFYLSHGVQHVQRGLEAAGSTVGHRVMRSSYCIRREMGECLRRGSRLHGELYLVRGRQRYRIDFDCARCEMSLTDCSEKQY
ncbi:MAG: U32 family peptidase [Alistipes sp.]|nr:U32 family peptidase [Alistipes sp.]